MRVEERHGVRWAPAALCAVLLWLYWPVLGFAPTTFDDVGTLLQLEHAPLATIGQLDRFGHLRPLKSLAFWLLARTQGDIALWRAASMGVFLCTVLAVHWATTKATRCAWLALAVTGCWALHPTTASVVAWLSAQSVLWCLLGIVAYLACSVRALHVRSMPAQLGAAAALVLAVASHELGLVAPVVLLVYMRSFERRRSALELRATLATAAVTMAVYIAAYALAFDTRPAYRFADEPAWLLSLSSMRYLAMNTRLWLWPWGTFGVLLEDAPAEHMTANALAWVAALLALLAAWKFRRHDPIAILGLAWFALFLLPVCNVIPLGNTPVAVHYLFIPSLGLALAGCRALSTLVQSRRRLSERTRRALLVAVPAALCLAWVPETREVIHAWGAEERLYQKTLASYPQAIEPLVNLSAHYLARRQYAQAETQLALAQRIAPGDIGVVRNAFALYVNTGRPERALAVLSEHPALQRHPDLLIRRGEALEALERHREASDAFGAAFELTRDREERYIAGYRLVIALLRSGERSRADALVNALLVEYPDAPELRLARRLLDAE